jgi:nicotinamide riboside kinase
MTIVAILGAESTGKTTLADALARRLADETGLRVAAVPEWLRLWCERERRVPLPHEQRAIADVTWQRIERAAATHDIVVADTTPLQTAVYSLLLFGDDSLVAEAVERQRRCAHTLLTALDLPWVPDGHQRDGPQVQAPVDATLRRLLDEHALPYAVIGGRGDARLEHALDAVAPLVRAQARPGMKGGLFTRLAARDAAQPRWVCVECDLPECEHALLARGEITSRDRSP